ncbi:MAG: 2-oxoacid:acceptor oxidoreductase family protein [Candidatus Coatesbacteria bacterium]|nr:2-oxoacid:acceptor oxidoreductase family protein [Candidatus Coatesbacteria bacterium]
MKEMLEIRWHGRGGQGAKTAADLLAQAAIHQGKFAQGFPEYGPERMGAPMRSYDRISEKPITIHSAVEYPDIVIILDQTLLKNIPVTSGLKKDGIILINSSKDGKEIRELLKTDIGSLFIVDANKISKETIGRELPNTPLIGALIKVTKIMPLEPFLKDLTKKFEKKFSDKIIEGNINAVKRAFEEVKEHVQ